MSEINYVFGFEDLKIVQKDGIFRFSLDSVLLGCFSKIQPRTNKILDIGCGNGIIPLVLSKRTNASITGVELQKEVYELAKQSISLNALTEQISLVHADIVEFSTQMESDQYDLITCNPPYFKWNENSHLNQTEEKTMARHETTLNLEQLFKIARKLLKNNGSIALVHRPERLIDILMEMKKNNIEPKRVQFIYPKKGKEANILLIEGSKNGKSGLKILEPLYVHQLDGTYTEEILEAIKNGGTYEKRLK